MAGCFDQRAVSNKLGINVSNTVGALASAEI